MTNQELKQKFEVTGKSARDFIRWAAEKGVKVHDATVSRHIAGTQGITQAWELAYLFYFSGFWYGCIDDAAAWVGFERWHLAAVCGNALFPAGSLFFIFFIFVVAHV